jgi:hypothetical protein
MHLYKLHRYSTQLASASALLWDHFSPISSWKWLHSAPISGDILASRVGVLRYVDVRFIVLERCELTAQVVIDSLSDQEAAAWFQISCGETLAGGPITAGHRVEHDGCPRGGSETTSTISKGTRLESEVQDHVDAMEEDLRPQLVELGLEAQIQVVVEMLRRGAVGIESKVPFVDR